MELLESSWLKVNPKSGGCDPPTAPCFGCSSHVWCPINMKLLDISDTHVLDMCIKFQVSKLNNYWDICHSLEATFGFFPLFLNFPLNSPASWLRIVDVNNNKRRKKGDGSATFWRPGAWLNWVVWSNSLFPCITNRWNFTLIKLIGYHYPQLQWY